jgi:arylsulfate sulfotransferase
LAGKTNAAGYDFYPSFYHHDICPLPNGHLIVLLQTSKQFTDLPGYPGTIEVIGDALVDLDENWNPVWSWNSFDYLDVNRHLNGLPDWTHGNAVIYSPKDGDLFFSMRHQSWVIKIDYANGSGTGNILWRLGYEGDFALTQNGIPSTDPSLWFAFQHYPSIVSESGALTTMSVWDNGDFRVTDTNGNTCLPPACYSRAVIFKVDESAMIADLMWQDLPGLYGLWGGSISQLENTNIEFDLNAPLPTTTFTSQIQEVTQTSSPQVVWQMDIAGANAYRAYRVPSLYPGVTWQ